MYTKVEGQFWKDEKLMQLSNDAKFLMLYLLTSPHRNLIGFYYLPIPYACFDLGWDEQQFKIALDELIKLERVKYDFKNHVILICNYLKYNKLENQNQVKSAIEKLTELPETPLFQDFMGILGQYNKPFMQPLKERLAKRLDKPVAVAVAVTVTGTVTGAVAVEEGRDEQIQDGPIQPDEIIPPDVTTTERECLNVLKHTPNYPYNYEKDLALIRDLTTEFPDINILEELKKWAHRKKYDEPLDKKSKPRGQIRNWLAKAKEFNTSREFSMSTRAGPKAMNALNNVAARMGVL